MDLVIPLDKAMPCERSLAPLKRKEIHLEGLKAKSNIATRFLKKWLHLPRSATRVVLYYPGVCCPSISHVSREAKLSLLACVSASADQRLRELGLQLHFGNVAMQIEVNTYSILLNAKKQLSTLPSARSLYVKAKHLLRDHTTS